MGSLEQNSPKKITSEAETAPEKSTLGAPPDRPTLVSPPQRPVRPAVVAKPEATVVARVDKAVTKPVKSPVAQPVSVPPPALEPIQTAETSSLLRYQPIAPPSEPMQYRAIGVVRGTYEPAEADQLNRGNLTTVEGCVIDAVLLGRITSLIKKHIDLTIPHLWVVYPRTRREMDNDDQDLHLQIVGVWEPETLGLPGEAPPESNPDNNSEAVSRAEPDSAADAAPKNDAPDGTLELETAAQETKPPEAQDTDSQASETKPEPPNLADLPPVEENFFSIRGEVVKYDPEYQEIAVKILQVMKRAPGASKPFKLTVQGTLEGRTVGYFWDFKVKREDKLLVLQDASVVGIVPPKKRPKGSSGMRRNGPPSRRPGGATPMPSRRPMGAQGSPRPRKPGLEEQSQG